MERLAEKRVVEIIERTFSRSEAAVITEFGFDASRGVRRWVDILIDHVELGFFAIEVKGSSNARSIVDWLNKMHSEQQVDWPRGPVPLILPSQDELFELLRQRDNRSKSIRFLLVLPNMSRDEFITVRTSQFAQFTDSLIFREDLDETRLRARLLAAPSLRIDGDEAPVNETNYSDRGHNRGGYKVFISYRRDDSRWAAGRIADRLKLEFRDDVVFLDTKDIHLGGRWRQRIQEVLTGTSIVLAVVADKWLTISDPDSGKRRIDDPNDILRNELVYALSNDLMVIPVLLDCTKVPRGDHLPVPLQDLFENEVIDISANKFERDMGPLITELRTLLGLQS